MKRTTLVIILLAMFVVSCLALTACHEHEFGQWTVVTPATCTQIGQEKRACECGEFEVRDIPATGHTFGEWTIIENSTCTELGQEERVCACGEKEVRDIALAKHTYGDWIEVKAATCTEAGIALRSCTCGVAETKVLEATGHSHEAVVTNPTCTAQGYTTHTCHCGDSYVDTYVDALGHTEGSIVVENNVDPTCTVDGSYNNVVYCTVCKEELSRQAVTVDALGHDYVDRVCDICGEFEPSVGLEYMLSIDETYYIVSDIGNCTDTYIVIPAMYNEKPVRSIRNSAFYNCSSLIGIIIPDSVASIGDGAFHGCSSLTSITIPNGITSIGFSVFDGCSSLTSIIIPESVTSIDGFAFYGCSSLTNITIPDSVTFIDWYAFEGCSSLTSIIIPDSVTSIGTYAFSSCYNLKTISLSEGLTTIGDYAFQATFALLQIEIPSSVTGIGEGAFFSSSITKVLYAGTKEQWNSISIGASNEILNNANIVFNHPDHNYVPVVTDPTCIEQGYTTHTCHCGDILGVDTYVDALGHTEGTVAVENNVDPKCTVDGSYDNVIYCTVCKAELSREIVIVPALGHTISSWLVVDQSANAGDRMFAGQCEICQVVEQITLYQRFEQLTYVTFGDSITYGIDGVDWGLMEDTYPELVSKALGFKTFNNLAVSGATFCQNTLNRTNMTQTILSFTGEADIISLMLGVNDCYVGLPLGTPASRDNTTIYGSLFLISEYLTSNYGDAFIFYMTPFPAKSCYVDNSAGYNLEDVANAIKHVAALYDIPVLDMYLYSEYENVEMNNPNGDGLHPSQSFMRDYAAPKIEQFIKDNYGVEYKHSHTIVVDEAVAPTCTTTGLAEGSHCSICHEILVAQQTVDALGHNFEESDICSNCEQNIADVAVDSYNMSATADDKVRGYVVPRFDGKYDVYIKGTGAMKDYSSSPFAIYDDTLVNAYIENGVTSIGNYAFSNCSSCINVHIPSSVTRIGEYTFHGCSNIADIVIPSSVTRIGKYAFVLCGNLASITIQGSPQICKNAFHVTAYYNNGDNWENNVLYIDNCLIKAQTTIESCTIKEGTTVIADEAFSGCSSLTRIKIPSSVTNIGSYAFSGCDSLDKVEISDVAAWCNLTFDNTSTTPLEHAKHLYINGEEVTNLIIPASVTSIPDYAFYNCSSITSVTFEEGSQLTSIGYCAFESCTNLKNIVIPSSVTSMGSRAFYGCSSLESITLPFVGATPNGTSNTTHFGYIFGAKSFDSNGSNVPVSLKEVTITGGTSIDSEAFRSCSGLTSITITGNIRSIGYGAFQGCSSLTNIVIPDSVTSIAQSAFMNCNRLTSITLPFVGSTPDSKYTPFGYIFGATDSSDNDNYVPLSLKNVVITGGTTIQFEAFLHCASIESVTLPDSLIKISEAAFYGCTNLTSIVIPNSVTSIGVGAFAGCSSLESITIPFVGGSKTANDTYQYPFGYIFGTSNYEGSTATNQYYYDYSTSSEGYSTYYIPTSLKSVTITGGNIPYGAFSNCANLTSVTIGDGATSIGMGAFIMCSNLTSIVIPDSVTSIGSMAFAYCSSLSSIVIGNGVISIGGEAFAECSNLVSVSLGNRLTTIYQSAFRDCPNLTNIILPDSLISIGDRAFANCSSLTSIKIPSGVTSIGQSAFARCTNLANINVSVDNTAYQSIDGNLYSKDRKTLLQYAIAKTETSFNVPDSVTSIAIEAFVNCKNLTNIVISDSVTSIGYHAFQNCNNLTSITIPHGVSIIEANTFYGCSSLINITIPTSVRYISHWAFKGCSSLTTVYFAGTEEQWNNIDIDDFDDGNSALINANIVFNHSDHNYIPTVTAPTCTEQGYTTHTCHCGDSYVDTYVDALGHTDSDWITDVAPTCTTAGSKYQECSICGETLKTESIDALGHSYESVVTAPTCTEQGYTIHTCHCGDSYVDSYVAANGVHNFQESDTCEYCEQNIADVSVEVYNISATADDNVKGYIVVRKNGNYDVYIKGTGAMKDYDLGLPSSPFDNNLYTLVGIHIANGVTHIGDYAFTSFCDLKNITIPESLTSIGDYSFAWSSSLKTVAIPSNVISIGESAFSGCAKLTTITIEGAPKIGKDAFKNTAYYTNTQNWQNKVLHIGNCLVKAKTTIESYIINEGTTVIASSAFEDCINLTSITIPNSVTSIGSYAFNNCTSLIDVTFGDYSKLSSIEREAFSNCKSLTSIMIPSSVISIGYYAFFNCASLNKVEITDVAAWCNIHFSEGIGNPLYWANHLYLNGEEITELIIPEGVTSISAHAFVSCTSITSITVPSSVISISKYALPAWDSLVSVIFEDPNGWYINATEGAISGSYKSMINPSQNATYFKDYHHCYWYKDPNGHIYTLMETAPTCTTQGYTTYTCTKCSYSYIDTYIDALGHNEIKHDAQEPTCTGIGWNAYVTCSRCNYATFSTIPATGHTYENKVCTACGSKKPSDYLKYTLSDDKTYYIVSGIGSCTDTDVVIPAIYNSKPVTAIGDKAFYNCTSLTSVTIPDSVTSIGQLAFAYCLNAININIPEHVTHIGDKAFSNCQSLNSISIPVNITTIGEAAFGGCNSLTSIVIPDSVTSIGDGAFFDCDALRSVIISDSVISIGERAFWQCSQLESVIIPDSVTSIGARAFDNCRSLTSVVIGNSVKTIGDDAFYNCISLTSVVIPDSVTLIGKNAFSNCTSLTNVAIGNSVTSIGRCTFLECTSLTSVTIGNAVTSIEWEAFGNCSSLTSIIMPNGLTTIDLRAFFNCSSLSSIVIPKSVTTIGNLAFDDCSSLTDVYYAGTEEQWSNISIGSYNEYLTNSAIIYGSIGLEYKLSKDETSYIVSGIGTCTDTDIRIPVMHDGKPVTSIGSQAFSYCTSRKSITIPSSVTSIGAYAFYNCTNLTSITIPASVKSIDVYAFSGTGLTSVKFEAIYGWYVKRSVDDLGGTFLSKIDIYSKDLNAEYLRNTYDDYYWYYTCKGHSYYGIVSQPTCTEQGYTTYTCTYCKDSYVDKYVDIDDTAHSYVDGTCTYCGDRASVGLAYTLSEDETYYIVTGIGTCTDTDVVIPSRYNELPVTSIRYDSFNNCTGLTSVIIPASVTSIESYAFYNCTNLTSITIKGYSKVSANAFLNSAYYNNANNWIEDVLYIDNYLIVAKSTIISCAIREGTTIIADRAFFECKELVSVTIPSSVTSLGNTIFYGCNSLTSITILGDVTSIDFSMFSGCTSLTSITIPSSVTSINSSAFYNCVNLKNVFYTGTEEQWNNITINSGNECLINANITYNYTGEEN